MNNHAVIADSAKIIEEVLWNLANQKSIDNSGYYDSADMKQIFKISERTLCRWRKNGTVPYVKMGGKIYYPMQEIKNRMLIPAQKD